ncbi:caspase family protein, partial [Streptomyces sp. UNOC14_S4]
MTTDETTGMTGDATAARTTGLAAPGARAVLVGTGSHAPGSALPALPGVDTTLDDLARALRDVCGMPEEHIHRVPADAPAADVLAAVEQAVTDATGTVLFCYTGHGLLGPGDELYLATHATAAEDRIAHGVPYRVVKDLLGGVVGGSVVLLDCCFSGRAAPPGNDGPRGVFDSALPDGSFLLTSASGFAVSYAPEGERHTLFGGRVLRLLEEGDPSGPPLLTLDDIHAYLDRAFRDGPVRPHRRSDGTLGTLVVAPNRAYRPERPAAALPPADVPCPYPGMEPFRPEDHAHFFGRDDITA